MASYVKGALSYFSKDNTKPADTSATPQTNEHTENPGYLQWVKSGAYNVGSSTLTAGVESAKWLAGATYNAGTGLASATGSAVASSTVVNKVFSGKSKEHRD